MARCERESWVHTLIILHCCAFLDRKYWGTNCGIARPTKTNPRATLSQQDTPQFLNISWWYPAMLSAVQRVKETPKMAVQCASHWDIFIFISWLWKHPLHIRIHVLILFFGCCRPAPCSLVGFWKSCKASACLYLSTLRHFTISNDQGGRFFCSGFSCLHSLARLWLVGFDRTWIVHPEGRMRLAEKS